MSPIKKIIKYHLYLFGILFLNFLVSILTGLGLNYQGVFIFKIVLYSSGVVLFFICLKERLRVAWYFSFYSLSFMFLAFLFMFNGIFLAILASIALFPIFPLGAEHRSGDLAVYEKFPGFMGNCCAYDVMERELLIFERKIGEVHAYEVQWEGTRLHVIGDTLEVVGKQTQYIQLEQH